VSLDPAATDMRKPGIVNQSFPLVWWHPYGSGKVLYNAFGHRPEVWRSRDYQTMLVNAILWITGTLR
jgi:type 1 glutamine amidotransferase